MADICAKAVDAAAHVAPDLREDLQSRSFGEGVVAPAVLAILSNPSILPDSAGLAADFIDMFVVRFAKDGGIDEALARIFSTERADLLAAFEAFCASLKFQLSGSERWRDLAHQQLTAEIHRDVQILRQFIEPSPGGQAMSFGAARGEAKAASVDLLEWPRDIFGAQIERPEFAALRERLAEARSGATLLVGEAGSGKSALLSALTDRLERDGVSVLAIKADRLPPDVRTTAEVAAALGMTEPMDATLRRLAENGPTVLLIDQLDAVSDVMDRRSARMTLLLRLVASLRDPSLPQDEQAPIHVVVSSRHFEADHDARFQQLGAVRITLSLPTRDQVSSLLAELAIDAGQIPVALAETARRPFALKLIVDLLRRGVTVDDLLPGQLLQRWLQSVDLGEPELRARVVALLTRLANDMIATETLWRPTDVYELEALAELRQAQACGIVVGNARGQVGFSHQSWLDDFQAKGFATGRSIAEYAWQGQDSLFPRAAVLRGLQRLRAIEPDAYLVALDLLLGDDRTRRHLRHLVADLLSSAQEPLPREAAWIERLVREDAPLARRALPRLVADWPIWRETVLPWLEATMTIEGMEWFAASALSAEAAFDADGVMDLLDRVWSAVGCDDNVLRVIDQSGLWTARMRVRVLEIMSRVTVSEHYVAHWIQERTKAGRVDDALDLAAMFFETGDLRERCAVRLYELEKLAAAVPGPFAARLLPRFVELAMSELKGYRRVGITYEGSAALGWDWQYDSHEGGFFEALRVALRATAAADPDGLAALLRPFYDVEIEEIQQVIADSLAAGGVALAAKGLEFLLADARRLDVGDAHGNDQYNVGRTVHGWSGQQLVRAIVPGLDRSQLEALRDHIERWARYPAAALVGIAAADRRRFHRWAEEARFPLLECLPPDILDTRRRRQIREWRIDEPVMRSINRMTMANFVGSPMSSTSMERASDDAIMRMLDEVHDGAGEILRHRSAMIGGASQLAQAFGAFATAKPERAMVLIDTRFEPERHEYAAGAALRELARADAVDAARVRALIHLLDARGFSSASWRNEVAWAMSTLADRLGGLEDADVAMLDRWMERDAAVIAEQTTQRLEAAARSAEHNARQQTAPQPPHPILFGHHGGLNILPQRNFSLLSAIADGLLQRSEPAFEDWVATMERHVADPEDPEIWSALLDGYGNPLWWVDRARAEAFFEALFAAHPAAFARPGMVGMIWRMRTLMPHATILAIAGTWLAGEDAARQAAGELVGGIAMVEDDIRVVGDLAAVIMDPATHGPARTGYLMSVAAAWRESVSALRERAHRILVAEGPSATNDDATAIARAMGSHGTLLPDVCTREMLSITAANPALLAATDNFFIDALRALLLHPGFEADVLNVLDALSALATSDVKARRRLFDGDLVQIAVALQRSDGELRKKAMDVYERLLDAEAAGAAEAAEASLIRRG
ncbi:ATP-binding protein [soil metagenome]